MNKKGPLPWGSIDWGRVVKTWGVATAACSAVTGVILTVLCVSAARDERQRQWDLEHPRWTDKNRWPHGE